MAFIVCPGCPHIVGHAAGNVGDKAVRKGRVSKALQQIYRNNDVGIFYKGQQDPPQRGGNTCQNQGRANTDAVFQLAYNQQHGNFRHGAQKHHGTDHRTVAADFGIVDRVKIMVKIQSDREHHIKKDQSQKCFVFQKLFPGGVFSVGRLASAHFRHGEAEHTAQAPYRWQPSKR